MKPYEIPCEKAEEIEVKSLEKLPERNLESYFGRSLEKNWTSKKKLEVTLRHKILIWFFFSRGNRKTSTNLEGSPRELSKNTLEEIIRRFYAEILQKPPEKLQT